MKTIHGKKCLCAVIFCLYNFNFFDNFEHQDGLIFKLEYIELHIPKSDLANISAFRYPKTDIE